MNEGAEGFVTIPAAELRALQAQLQEAQKAANNLQLFLVLEMRERGRSRYTASQLEAARAEPWMVQVVQDPDTSMVTVSVMLQPPEPAPIQRSTPGQATRAARPDHIRILPPLAAVK